MAPALEKARGVERAGGMRFAPIAANVLGWAVLQLAIAWGAVRIDSRRFAQENRFFRVRRWERGFYRRRLLIRRWKRALPDGERWVRGGFSKNRLAATDPGYLQRFVAETRRGEAAHWAMIACLPLFCIWNPVWACLVNALYAAASNLPCIVVQRYNREAIRMRLSSQLARQGSAARADRAGPSSASIDASLARKT